MLLKDSLEAIARKELKLFFASPIAYLFLAGLGVATLTGLEAREALQLANRAATRNCELSGLEELYRLAAVC